GLLAEALAMLFPTSGSSGEPKLIAYATTTLQAKVQSSMQLMQVEPQQRVLIAGSHAQYGFLHHALVFLLAGGTLCLFDIKQSGFQGIVHAINELGVRHIRFTPSLFRKFVHWTGSHAALQQLDAVRFSGEPFLRSDLDLALSVLQPHVKIQNVYGSTESALFIWHFSGIDNLMFGANIPIGHIYPFSSYAIQAPHDMDKGSVGELLIRSPYQALGDYENGKINDARFREYEPIINERIYASGDWVQQLDDTSLLHLGRIGRMVKLRGNRVYLNEVEQCLMAHTDVYEAAALVRETSGESILYAFVTSTANQLIEEKLHEFLAKHLPEYMLPRRIIMLPQMPLLVGGKLDYQALLDTLHSMESQIDSTRTHENDLQQLIQLWDDELYAGAHLAVGDFISLGGDSLGLMSLVVEAENLF
ncbi:MAG: amino acid adenylation domain-containing protein, partial [Chitinophagaceae bacterium]|nr:amino acid adenylation domain-containing protein [Chitinophagaceae bacterium]